MPRSEQINELAASLACAQGAMSVAIKDSVNPHFKSRYADLASVIDAVRPHLSVNGIAFVQDVTTEPGIVCVETTLYHKSGQWLSNKLAVACKDQSPQPVGSATTYARRYALMALCGIAPAEDDDGEAAQRPQPKPAPVRQHEPPKPDPQPAPQPTPTLPTQTNDAAAIEKYKTILKSLVMPDRNRITPVMHKFCVVQGKAIVSVPADKAAQEALTDALWALHTPPAES